MNQILIQYLQQQIRMTDERLKRFTHNSAGEKYPQRFMFVKLQSYIKDFSERSHDQRLIIIPGFRGVGKTTLIAQICSFYKTHGKKILFLSVEDAHNLFNIGVAELMNAYEHILGTNLETLKEETLIFLDEIQTDPKWAVTLKSFYEKTSNVFFCCTGSSALTLQTTSNLARRAIFEKMPPLSFIEYQMIKNRVYPTPGLKEQIKKAIYFSKNAEEVFENLFNIQNQVNQYWSEVDRYDVRKYLSYGTLPFALTMPNETTIYDSISLLLDKIIKLDLPSLGKFDTATLDTVKRILFAIAENDVTGFNKLENVFHISRFTIASIFDALEKAEVLIKIPAYGSNMTVAKKPSKYLFMTSAIRMAFFYYTGQESTFLVRCGKLLEDSVGSHLYREFILKDLGAIRYDSAQGGADFILQILNKKQLIIEVGVGDKSKKQIINSAGKIKSDYNLIFSNDKLQYDHELKIVFIPLDFYFLM